MKTSRSWVGYVLLAFFSVLMLRITLPYLAMEDTTAFLRIKQHVIHIGAWKIAFYVHVFTSMFALVAGFTQFSKKILGNRKPLHRMMGRLYVIVILGFSGPSGLIMAWYANGGWSSQLAFGLLSLLWLSFTFFGFRSIRNGNNRRHKEMMWRSYALTLSALTLRAWKLGIVWAIQPHPMDLYIVVAWLGWLPNLLLVEWWIRYNRSRPIPSSVTVSGQ